VAGNDGIGGLKAPEAIITRRGAPWIRLKQAGVFGRCRQPGKAAALVSGAAMDLYFMNLSRGFTPC